MMKAIQMDGTGGPEVLSVKEALTPTPSEEQVLIRVAATSVNRADISQRRGNYPPPKGDSEILGLEVAGVIEELGSNVQGWKTGQRVMTLVGGGAYAEYAVAYSSHLMQIPDSLDFTQAACVAETYITAFLNIFEVGGLIDGECVLLHGGGGGVNTAGIQLCRQLRPQSRVLVTASPTKLERVTALGADLAIDYKNDAFEEVVETATNGQGAHVILDHIGSKYLTPNLKALAVAGRLVIIGVMSGAKAEVNLARLMVKRQQIIGSVLRSRPVTEKAEITARFSKQVLPMFADGTLEPLVHQVLPLEDMVDAHRIMETSAHFGKIVIAVD
jgi:NADPH2:quinone reductase